MSAIARNSNRKSLTWIKTSPEKMVDLHSKFFLSVSFNVKAHTQENSQHIWMNFYKFRGCPFLNCVIRINFSLNTVDKDESFHYVNDLNSTKF